MAHCASFRNRTPQTTGCAHARPSLRAPGIPGDQTWNGAAAPLTPMAAKLAAAVDRGHQFTGSFAPAQSRAAFLKCMVQGRMS